MKLPALEDFLYSKVAEYAPFDPSRFPILYRRFSSHFKFLKHTRTIHVVGTNGKGSTGRFLALMLKSAGFSVAHFTSPHIHSFCERFWRDGSYCSKSELELAHQSILGTGKFDEASYFEYATLLALWLFRDCDFLVLEAGLGGEYDSTTSITRELSLFTPISFDHEELLGTSIEEIAGTKLRSMARRAILGVQEFACVNEIAREIARERGSDLVILELDRGGWFDTCRYLDSEYPKLGYASKQLSLCNKGKESSTSQANNANLCGGAKEKNRTLACTAEFSAADAYIAEALEESTVVPFSTKGDEVMAGKVGLKDSDLNETSLAPITANSAEKSAQESLTHERIVYKLDSYLLRNHLPAYQRANIALAYRAMEILGVLPDFDRICDFDLLGRAERHGRVILDVGHNPNAAHALLSTLDGARFSLIYNSYKDKNFTEILRLFRPFLERVYILEIDENPRILETCELLKTLEALAIPTEIFHGELPKRGLCVVFGSFSVVQKFKECYSGLLEE